MSVSELAVNIGWEFRRFRLVAVILENYSDCQLATTPTMAVARTATTTRMSHATSKTPVKQAKKHNSGWNRAGGRTDGRPDQQQGGRRAEKSRTLSDGSRNSQTSFFLHCSTTDCFCEPLFRQFRQTFVRTPPRLEISIRLASLMGN